MIKAFSFLFTILSYCATAQINGVYVLHKNQTEFRIKIVTDNNHIKLHTYTNDQKKWHNAQILKFILEENYIKFKNWQGVIYHMFIFDNRMLLLIDLHGNTWRYSKLFFGGDTQNPQKGEHASDNNCINNIIPSSDFNKLVANIKELDFDKTKLSTAKSSIRNSCISAEQAATLTSLMSFEESKLDFAMFAYQYTFDKHNYYMVSKMLEFNKSIEELNKFIHQK